MINHTDDKRGQANGATPTGTAEEHELILGGALGTLTRVLAYIGGLFLIVAVVLTVVSVAGRYLFGAPVPGDYELVEITCAIGVFLFFPYTHAISGNIAAEFFTSGLSARRREFLDLFSDAVFMLVALVLTWRISLGLIDKFETGETSILVRVPLWWPYGVAVASMALLTLVCLMRTVVRLGALRRW